MTTEPDRQRSIWSGPATRGRRLPGGRGDPVTGGIVVVVTFGALWCVCPGEATCGTTGAAALRVKVAFVDADPTTPLPGRRQVAVLSWSPG